MYKRKLYLNNEIIALRVIYAVVTYLIKKSHHLNRMVHVVNNPNDSSAGRLVAAAAARGRRVGLRHGLLSCPRPGPPTRCR